MFFDSNPDRDKWMDEIIHPLDSVLAGFVSAHFDRDTRIGVICPVPGSKLVELLTSNKYVCGDVDKTNQQFDLIISCWGICFSGAKPRAVIQHRSTVLEQLTPGGSVIFVLPGCVDIHGIATTITQKPVSCRIKQWCVNRFKHFRCMNIHGLKYKTIRVVVACNKVWC